MNIFIAINRNCTSGVMVGMLASIIVDRGFSATFVYHMSNKINTLVELAHRNNSLQVEMSLHLDTLS
jgi:hypothetical protein